MGAPNRTARAEAKRAIVRLKRAESEARGLAKELPKGARRARLDDAVANARSVRKSVAAERSDSPRRAARRAARAAAKLERVSRPIGAADGARGSAAVGSSADERAKARAKTIKQRRKQAQQSQKMAKFVAAHVIGASVSTSGDDDAPKRAQRRTKT